MIAPLVYNGESGLFAGVTELAEILDLLEWAERTRRHIVGDSPAALAEFVRAARIGIVLAKMADLGHLSPETIASPSSWCSVGEAAQMVPGTPARTIRRWLGAGRIPGARKHTGQWMIPVSAVLELVRR